MPYHQLNMVLFITFIFNIFTVDIWRKRKVKKTGGPIDMLTFDSKFNTNAEHNESKSIIIKKRTVLNSIK